MVNKFTSELGLGVANDLGKFPKRVTSRMKGQSRNACTARNCTKREYEARCTPWRDWVAERRAIWLRVYASLLRSPFAGLPLCEGSPSPSAVSRGPWIGQPRALRLLTEPCVCPRVCPGEITRRTRVYVARPSWLTGQVSPTCLHSSHP